MRITLLAILVFLAISAVEAAEDSTQAADSTPTATEELDGTRILTPGELRELWPGKVLTSSDGRQRVTYYRNGTVEAVTDPIGAVVRRDSGRWWFGKQSICQQISNFQGGRDFCFRVRKDEMGYMYMNSRDRFTLTQVD